MAVFRLLSKSDYENIWQPNRLALEWIRACVCMVVVGLPLTLGRMSWSPPQRGKIEDVACCTWL
jgi:hypothetical protein